MAAQHAADAGNSLVIGDHDNIIEAKDKANLARIYIGANKIIDDIRRSNYIFEIPQLKHQIPTLPDNG